MTGRLDGKVAFITGAARGQGRSHAVRLAEEGADVIAVDICGPVETVDGYPPSTPDDLAHTVELVSKLDRRIVATRGDVRDFAQLQGALARGVAELGRLDVVVANAGILTMGPAHEQSDEQWGTMPRRTCAPTCSTTRWCERPSGPTSRTPRSRTRRAATPR